MKAVAIKLKTYANNVSIVDNNDLKKRILNRLLIGLGVVAVCYILLLGSMVFNIVERKALEASARVLSNEVGDLELTYLSLSNKIDLNLSHSLGFSEAQAKFATRKKSLGSVKIANNEL